MGLLDRIRRPNLTTDDLQNQLAELFARETACLAEAKEAHKELQELRCADAAGEQVDAKTLTAATKRDADARGRLEGVRSLIQSVDARLDFVIEAERQRGITECKKERLAIKQAAAELQARAIKDAGPLALTLLRIQNIVDPARIALNPVDVKAMRKEIEAAIAAAGGIDKIVTIPRREALLNLRQSDLLKESGAYWRERIKREAVERARAQSAPLSVAS